MSEVNTTTAVEDAGHTKHYRIIVDGERHTVHHKEVSYEQVVKLAYPNPPSPDMRYTVTYRKAASHPHDGSLIAGQSVEVKHEGTIFNVKTTGRS